MNDWTKAAWQHLHATFAERYKKSPKWLAVGQAMASPDQRLWTYHQLDTRIIYLWPLLKKHNWTYRDLVHVTRSLPSSSQPSTKIPQLHSAAYPCQREQDFTVHCRTVLGLRKTGRGRTTKSGHPPGYEIARRIFSA